MKMTQKKLPQPIEKKIKQLEISLPTKIDREEYESSLEKLVSDTGKELKEMTYEYETLVDIYRTYLYNKDKYDLIYFRDKEEISYIKNGRRKAGFDI